MKRLWISPSLIALALACATDLVEPPAVGGQSGDDGDVVPQPIPPGIPGLPCEPAEQTSLAPDAQTLFGASGVELLSRVAPNGSSPLFWVPYDGLVTLDTPYSPGPSQTELAWTITLREGEPIVQVLNGPLPGGNEEDCYPSSVSVPVHVELVTTDGALAARVNTTLLFEAPQRATLRVQIDASALEGTLAFAPVRDGRLEWTFRGLTITAELWPGGSSGNVTPRILPSEAVPPQLTGPQSTERYREGASPGPSIPSHWAAVAVWPRREQCVFEPDASAVSMTDRLLGWSPHDIVTELAAHSPSALRTSAGVVPVDFTVMEPTGLVCASVRRNTLQVTLPARLAASAAATDGVLAGLDASLDVQLSARTNSDGSAFLELRWERDVEAMLVDHTRPELESVTGLALDVAEEYQRFWWAWQGAVTRETAAAPWTKRGELLVSSLDAEESARIEQRVAQGGPGPSISYDAENDGYTLPGDVLIDAELE